MHAKVTKTSLTLALFAIVTTGLTAMVYHLTKPIAQQQRAAQQKALLAQVVPADSYDEPLDKHCFVLSNPALGNDKPHRVWLAFKQQQLVAAAAEVTAPEGYAGNIEMLIGANLQGEIYGVRVLDHHETPGLGDKIELRVSDWIRHFTGKYVRSADDPRFAVKKDGGEFDQFTGATITPRAVINATKRATRFIMSLPERQHTLARCGENDERN